MKMQGPDLLRDDDLGSERCGAVLWSGLIGLLVQFLLKVGDMT